MVGFYKIIQLGRPVYTRYGNVFVKVLSVFLTNSYSLNVSLYYFTRRKVLRTIKGLEPQ